MTGRTSVGGTGRSAADNMIPNSAKRSRRRGWVWEGCQTKIPRLGETKKVEKYIGQRNDSPTSVTRNVLFV